MKKMRTDSLITAFNWAFGIIDNQDLTESQQLTLLHLVNRLNRNFWQPVRISENKLAVGMNKDKRTVANALSKLVELEIITVDEKGAVNLGIFGNDESFTDGRAETDKRNDEKNFGGNEKEERKETKPRGNTRNKRNSPNTETAVEEVKKLEIFTPEHT